MSLIGPKVTKLRPRKSKALTLEDVAECGIDGVEFWMTANVGKVVVLLEVMQQFTEKMAEIKEQGEDSEALQWARAQLEEMRSHLDEMRETMAVLTDYCESECDTASEARATRGWDDLFQQAKSGSAKLHDLTKTLNVPFGIVDKALDKKR
jgi:predicted nuclease with TOPRIM domain